MCNNLDFTGFICCSLIKCNIYSCLVLVQFPLSESSLLFLAVFPKETEKVKNSTPCPSSRMIMLRCFWHLCVTSGIIELGTHRVWGQIALLAPILDAFCHVTLQFPTLKDQHRFPYSLTLGSIILPVLRQRNETLWLTFQF